jgi:hypothetical protein
LLLSASSLGWESSRLYLPTHGDEKSGPFIEFNDAIPFTTLAFNGQRIATA